MHFLIPTIGSRGDVQPFIALAQGLKTAGHQVTLASHPLMRSFVEAYGVSFAPIGPDIHIANRVAAIRQKARFVALGLIQGMRFGFEMLERSHADLLTLCEYADLVVVPTAVAAGKNEAELSGLPYLSVTLMPWVIPWNDPDRPLFKRFIYPVIDGLVHLITTQPLNRIRKKQGLPPVGDEGFTSARLNLIPVSPAVFSPNSLWAPQHRLVGYWFAEAPERWAPTEELLAFLGAGDPPLLISLGAMSLGDQGASEMAALFINALQEVGVRALIQGWETAFEGLSLPPSIMNIGSLPHSWLLPKCAGLVHHGGYGTTAAGLRAGIPALVIPHIADQFYWAQRVYELGVGPGPIRRPALNSSKLAGGLDALVRDAEIRSAATALGVQIRSEDGLTEAINLIEESFQ
jgi:UDP:flavonoid glycosyltransferase YjiC (YdhE family)